MRGGGYPEGAIPHPAHGDWHQLSCWRAERMLPGMLAGPAAPPRRGPGAIPPITGRATRRRTRMRRPQGRAGWRWLSFGRAARLEEAGLCRAPRPCAEPPPGSPLPGQSSAVPLGRHTLPLSCSLLFLNTKSRNYFLNDCNFIF